LLLASLLVSIGIEWIGMHLWWAELGTEHSRQMLRAESQLLDDSLSVSWLRGRPAGVIAQLTSEAGQALKRSEIGAALRELARNATRRLGSSATWHRLGQFAEPYTVAARNISQLYMVRLTVLCLAAPLFLLLILVGLVDGLVQRDLRRWGGGRESSYVYHYAKRSNLVFVGLGAILYLAIPFSIHPTVLLLPFACVCAITVSLTASRFKKYL